MKGLLKPEYIALLISVIAVCVNVYIAWKNRRDALSKEEYFKLKQVVEKIISKLTILENDREKLKVYFENRFRASQNKNSVFFDRNDTFNHVDFNKGSGEIAALIEIYFSDLGRDWNYCLDRMSGLSTLTFILSKKIESGETIDWKSEVDKFNAIDKELGDKPKEISDKIKDELIKFKRENL